MAPMSSEEGCSVDMPTLRRENAVCKPGRGSENKWPVVAAVSVDEAGHPRYIKLATRAPRSLLPLLLIGPKIFSLAIG